MKRNRKKQFSRTFGVLLLAWSHNLQAGQFDESAVAVDLLTSRLVHRLLCSAPCPRPGEKAQLQRQLAQRYFGTLVRF